MLRTQVPGTTEKIQVARTGFADDLAETNLAGTIEEMTTVARASNRSLDAALQAAGMAQNADNILGHGLAQSFSHQRWVSPRICGEIPSAVG